MRSRLLTAAAGLVLTLTGFVVFQASPASAHCGGHGTHPDLYNAGGISFRNGTNIHRFPHISCVVDGQGFPSHGIDVHCVTGGSVSWFYVRNTTTGVRGWVRFDALAYDRIVTISLCTSGLAAHTLS